MFAIVVERGDKETKCCKNATVNEFRELQFIPWEEYVIPFALYEVGILYVLRLFLVTAICFYYSLCHYIVERGRL